VDEIVPTYRGVVVLIAWYLENEDNDGWNPADLRVKVKVKSVCDAAFRNFI
jgi:hypothetical protein